LNPHPNFSPIFKGKVSDTEARAHLLHNLNHIAMLEREEYDIMDVAMGLTCEKSKFHLSLNKYKIFI